MKRNVKEASLDELDGVIIKNRVGYSLNKIGVKKAITRVGLKQLIESIDIDEHNREYLANLKEQLETYDDDGYNFLGFNAEGIHRNGTEFAKHKFAAISTSKYQSHPEGWINAKGWLKVGALDSEDKGTMMANNAFTGTRYDIDGYDIEGYDIDGYNEKRYDREGYNRENYDERNFNREGIHRETGTIYDPEGYNREGYNEKGYNREGLDRNGKTEEELQSQQNQRRKNFLGLMNLAEGYAKGEISIEDYLKNHKITIEELIDFAKKQSMPQEIVTSLYYKKREYYQYKTLFSKKEYFKNKTTINGVEITEEIVDKVLAYLKANDRYLSLKIVNEHISAVARGELVLDDEEKQEEQALITEKGAKVLAKQVPMHKNDARTAVARLEEPDEMQKDTSEVSLNDE